MNSTEIEGLVDHLFRREAGRMIAALTRVLGARNLDLAEEVVQEALLKALQHWPFRGVPNDPAAWLIQVARNRALDHLRHGRVHRDKEGDIRQLLEGRSVSLPGATPSAKARLAGEPTDDQLRMIFLCCHPELARESQVALTLKVVCGFGVEEIAAAFLAKPATIAQRLVRAKKRLRRVEAALEFPRPEELSARLDPVLEVLYLLFNEGYASHQGEELLRAELCQEAQRLTTALARLPATDQPVVHALAALMYFQSSRNEARLDEEGELILLTEQDRGRWDSRALYMACAHLERAAQGSVVTPYHLQAAIASEHARASSPEATDWAAIVDLYDHLYTLQPTPIVALNRAVAVGQLHGAAAGLESLQPLEGEVLLQNYCLLHATRARFLADLGQRRPAAEACRRATRLATSAPQRRFLERLQDELQVPRAS